jgi:hypothetical protein
VVSSNARDGSRQTHMLVDQQDSNILSLGCEPFKSFFDSRIIRLAVNDKEVFLRVRGLRDMLPSHQLRCLLKDWEISYTNSS